MSDRLAKGGWVRVSDLVSPEQIAERTGVGVNAVVNWAGRPTKRGPAFPDPVRDVPRSRLWLWPQVEVWLRETGRTRYLE